jgi:uncharacterized SAM-binding protein YcdF (DUF218 family)
LNLRLTASARWNGRISVRATRGIRRAVVVLVVLGVIAALLPLGARSLGQWLVVADPLEPARAIVVLSGRIPFRAMEAASIYQGGWAREVWLSKEARTAEDLALDRLGLLAGRGEGFNRELLEHLGVPPGAIRLMGEDVQNTVDEVRLVAAELGRGGGEQVIIVTSKAHSRRVRAIWSTVVGSSPRAIIRYAGEDPYDAGCWWRNTRDALDVSREVFGLLNVWAGFPVQPDRQRR